MGMFSYEQIKKFNELETLVYNYVMENKYQVIYMTIRELADEVHVSTSTVMRFCKKVDCDGYSEFRVKFKMYLKQEIEKKPYEDIEEIQQYFRKVHTDSFEQDLDEVTEMIRTAEQVIFIGVGTSGILGKYGARYFSNLHKFSQYIEDPYYPILEDMWKSTIIIALSVSGETPETIKMVNRFKEHNCKIIGITNKNSCTLAKIADKNINYYVTEHISGEDYNVTTQVPVVFLLEMIGRRL